MSHGSIRTRRALSYRIVGLGRGWTMLIGAGAIVAQLSLGCGGDSTAEAPPPFPSDPSSNAGADDSEETPKDTQSGELDPVVVNPSPSETPVATSTVVAGALATTATVPFGGDGFCKYDMTLKDVAIEIELRPNGDVARATVRDLAVEKALDGCPYAPMDPSIQDFTLKSHAVTTTGTRVEFIGAKANRPETALVVDLVPSASGYLATATWKWSVTAKTSLTKK